MSLPIILLDFFTSLLGLELFPRGCGPQNLRGAYRESFSAVRNGASRGDVMSVMGFCQGRG